MKCPMGIYVEVKGYMHKTTKQKRETYYESQSCTPRIGMVVGMRWAREGEKEFEGEIGWVFTPTLTRLFYLVSFGALNRPVLVREEDMTPAEPVKLPMLAGEHAAWDDRARAEQRQYAAEQKRVKGRFAR